jgi:hypothetical protein
VILIGLGAGMRVGGFRDVGCSPVYEESVINCSLWEHDLRGEMRWTGS